MLLVFVGTQSLKPARSQARQKIAVNLVAGVYPLHRIEQLCYYKGNISMTKDNENITPSKKNGTKLFAASLRTLADLVEGTEGIKLCISVMGMDVFGRRPSSEAGATASSSFSVSE